MLPVEGPLQQELARSFGEAATALVRLQDLSDHIVQPGSPLVQGALLLQGDLKILLQALNHALVTLAHPRRLFLLHTTECERRHHGKQHSAVEKMANIYLNIGKVHPVEVRQHLVDL